MTTKVTVHANHGWPVDVTTVFQGAPAHPKRRVAAGETGEFYVHSGHDLLIHEVQPDEIAAEAAE